MANFVCLAAARSHLLTMAGWNCERDGLFGAPPITVVVGEQRHVSIELALRYLGLGGARTRVVAADDQGRMRAGELVDVLGQCQGPTLVCAQAGNVDSGAFDPIEEICAAAHQRGAWLHVDGAFGLWAAASSRHQHLVRGVENADSWATDSHRWLNVPYDSGLAFVSRPTAHWAAMSLAPAAYLVPAKDGYRDNGSWVPEMSRRARGFPVWAAIRELGRAGIAEMVDRCCAHARLFADLLRAQPDVRILNDVVLNQVLVRFLASDGDHDARTRAVVEAVQSGGISWLGGTTWRGGAAMRISVSNWSTTTADVRRTVAAILAASRAA